LSLSPFEVKNAHSFISMERGLGKGTCLYVGNKDTNRPYTTLYVMIHIKSVSRYVAKLSSLNAFVRV
jgi:hypothetical protein